MPFEHLWATRLAMSRSPGIAWVAQYAELIEELRRVAALGSYLAFVGDAANRLEAAGAPKMAARVRSVPVSSSGEDTTFPTTWRDAWNWARSPDTP